MKKKFILKYAVPVYNYFLKNYCNYKDILFTIDSETFLEMLLQNLLRKFQICHVFKTQTNAKEKQLIAYIEYLERSNLDDEKVKAQ